MVPPVSIDISIKEITQLYNLYIRTLDQIEDHEKAIFNFQNCSFFSNHACVFLGGLDLFIKAKYGVKKVSYEIKHPKVSDYFDRLGYFNKQKGWTNLPYSDFSIEDIKEKKPYRDINELLMSSLFPFKSEKAKDIIKEVMDELFLNVYQHSGSPAGATASAQYYPTQKTIRFSIVDFGVGISKHIQRFFEQKRNKKVTTAEALLKAFEEGFTTKEGASGTGLKTIKDLICANESKISIFCNNIFYQINGKDNSENGFKLKGPIDFSGTFVIIDFNTKKICYSI